MEDNSMVKNEAMFFYADMDKIIPNPKNQNKHTPESIADLAATIKEIGRLINPISVRAKGLNVYEIICGERRHKAAELLGWQKIPAFLWDVEGEIDADMMRVIENSVREFDYLSECLELANLHQQEMSTENISRVIGQSASRVGEKIAVGHIPMTIIEKIRNSKIDWTLVRIISLLRLRQKDGAPLQGYGNGVKGIFDYDYSEIDKAVDMVNAGQLQLDELQIYIVDRRLEMEYRNREKILADQLAIIEKTQKKEIEKLVETAKSGANTELNQKLQRALNEAQRLTREKSTLLSQMSKQNIDSADLAKKETTITNLKSQLTKKETEIQQTLVKAEREKQQLLGETEKIAEQKAKELAKKQFEDYKKTMDATTALTIKTIEDNAKKLIEQTQIKTKKTIQDGITHFIRITTDLDASLRILVVDQLKHMTDNQIKDIALEISRLKRTMAQMELIIAEYMKNSNKEFKDVNIIDMGLEESIISEHESKEVI